MIKVKTEAKVEVTVKLKVMVMVFDTQIRFPKKIVKIRPAGAFGEDQTSRGFRKLIFPRSRSWSISRSM